jgi:hypothetical protein
MSISHQNIINMTAIAGLSILNTQYFTSVADTVIERIVAPHLQWSRLNSITSQRRRTRVRKSWAAFSDWLTDRQFRRYFRMSKALFQQLVDEICAAVGAQEFKSEQYIQQRIDENLLFPDYSNNIVKAHHDSTGGFVSGEIKLAITLRILGGATYLDCSLFFEVSFNHAHKIFKEVIDNWIRHPSVGTINGIQYCCDDEAMSAVALQFAQSSRGVITGCIGALDGWLVKIKKPGRRDGVENPQSFYSRKGFYAVNTQVIVDRNKRILSRSIMSRGAEHDSTAFRNSGLYAWLIDNYHVLVDKGFHFIGDSAYAIKSFLHPPYDNAAHASAEDNFNFFHSSARIIVECTFGEIDLRFGILWKPLNYSLKFNCSVIDACFVIHNYIVKHREGVSTTMDHADFEVFDEDCRRFFAIHHELTEGIEGGERDMRRDCYGNRDRGGRPQRSEAQSTAMGIEWRDNYRNEIQRQRLIRPQTNWYRRRNRVITEY